ncbi:MAG: ATP phosphoribosyltransferase [Chloroflexi bacterium]|nr:ATP phosphoribosyltransferase [Chloroflexota bacterium]MBA3740919.1 ATP phosphoribosyltransferase [Chloroflexota bacterium]HEV8054143.1 ATP phosphoribosyltransferase [Candidatus Limnocylindrales bacterium]
MTTPLRLAVPNKGRLAEPAIDLLHSAGLEFELSERRLSAAVRNADIELLFVRTDDIAEYVADGLVELGLTGADLVAEHGGELHTVLPLGFGACSLVLAVPRDGELATAMDLAGRRIATSFPRVTAAYLASAGVEAQVVEVRGAVEVTPQLGVADAVVDLVASGSTLRMNGLRPIATLLASEAVLVARNGTADADDRVSGLIDMLRSVLDARGREYMMMNAPVEALERIRELIPGLSGPTVMPLADPAFIAVHSVVERSQLWRIVPALKAVGARDILVVPIEKVVR